MVDKVTLKFTGAVQEDKSGQGSSGELKAYMVLEKEGHQAEADARMMAFRSAAGREGVRIRDGVCALTAAQLEARAKQLADMPAHAVTVAECRKAIKAIEREKEQRLARRDTPATIRARQQGLHS